MQVQWGLIVGGRDGQDSIDTDLCQHVGDLEEENKNNIKTLMTSISSIV
jgi:hypothetical protein